MRTSEHFSVASVRSIEHIDHVAGNEADGKTKANMNTIRITAYAHLGYRPWLARITGSDPQYGLARDFLRPTECSRSRSGRTGEQTWEIDVGLYQRGGTKRDDGLFIVWRKDGQLFRLTVDMARAQAIARLLDEGKDFETARQATKHTKEASTGHA